MASNISLEELRLTPAVGITKVAEIDNMLTDVIAHLQNFSTALPTVELVTNEETRKFYIHLPTWGVTLVFEAQYQLLELLLVDCKETKHSIFVNKTYIKSLHDFRREVRDVRIRTAGSTTVEAGEGLTAIVKDGELQKILVHRGNDCFAQQVSLSEQISIVEFVPGSAVLIHLPKQSSQLPLTSSPEAVIDLFGLPSKVWYHCTRTELQSTDYVYNYFRAGLDFVFDGVRHELKAVVGRNNMPEDYCFGVYHRCQFWVKVGDRKGLDVLSNLADVQEALGSCVVSQRASDHNFDPVAVYSVPGLEITVLPNGLIAAVSIFRP